MLGKAFQADGVERVARQQPQVRVHLPREAARLAVVHEEALVYGLERECAVACELREFRGGFARERPQRLVYDSAEAAHALNAFRAASIVRSTCSGVCAREGNQAS